MAKQKEKNVEREKYFVGTESPEDYATFPNLKEALKYYWRSRIADPTKEDQLFVAKEIKYRLLIDEQTGNASVIPVGDFRSKNPYYCLSKEERTPSVESFLDFEDLVANNMLPLEGSSRRVAHGLELKLEIK